MILRAIIGRRTSGERSGRFGRRLVAAQSTLLGRMILGPAWTISRFLCGLARDVWRGKGKMRAIVARHLLECAVVLVWVIGVCGMPFWIYVACFVYPGVSLALVRSFAEHRAEQEVGKRTAIVENARILGPLFLFNNLHAAHHLRGRLPWYQVPKFYRLNRAALIEGNGGLVYNSYFDVARRYLLSSPRQADSPGLGPAGGVSG